ncbi:class I mannose-6-phosphate isomerase [Compostibacter hankyongensis]|uniref:Mannose-6-phosphate isomerase n=1 Tax=Compostibacter hankyongensis TaxID=1007089 RepID=A0ABP8FG52_9BACT
MDISVKNKTNPIKTNWRAGSQPLLPVRRIDGNPQGYDLYPTHSLGAGKIFHGYASLAAWIIRHKFVALDGYAGVFWTDVKTALEKEFEKQGVSVCWVDTTDYLKSPGIIREMASPYLGTPQSVWGTKTDLSLDRFYDLREQITPRQDHDLTLVIGTAAALMAENAHLVYLDLPKSELQLRMRAGSITNLGADAPEDAGEMYKRFYFVDWVVLNEHKKQILDKIEVIADAQWKDTLSWMAGADFKNALHQLGKTAFRVRPWFEPGAWGGQWIKEHIEGINKEEVNYAWSFELIVPENGLVFESDGYLLEASFDFLMFREKDAVLGNHAGRFGYEFPVRFDFLDTWDGGNLSIQCHPSLSYIRENFGETITQDETYYILDCQENAEVYLGFQDDIDPAFFRKQLEDSQAQGTVVDIPRFVQTFPAQKHDLFLIPNGTVHSAGKGNLVLEISATPYIFTFKMYDWLRLDLNGKPRAINIEHAFNNLQFDRKGKTVADELISRPVSLKKGTDWEIIHLPTHKAHFYDVHRAEFDTSLTLQTEGSFHVLMLVEGTAVAVQIAGQPETIYQYAETFVIPAAAASYTLVNQGTSRAKVIKAFLKA